MTRHADGDCLLPEPWSVHYDFSNGSIELKAVAFQYVFSTTLLYYTFVKFIQEKNEAGIQGEATQAWAVARRAAAATIHSIEGNPSKRQDFWSGRFVGCGLFLSGPDSACA